MHRLAHKVITLSLGVLLTGWTEVPAAADDWSNWRGPQHNGISSERHWGGDWAMCTPHVRWRQQVGTGFSSLAVAAGRVYTMGNSSLLVGTTKKAHDVVYCLDASNGAIAWTYAYEAP